VGHFCFFLDPDPDPLTRLNPDPDTDPDPQPWGLDRVYEGSAYLRDKTFFIKGSAYLRDKTAFLTGSSCLTGPMYFVFYRLYPSSPSHHGSVWLIPVISLL
jgi:hypothetical protein